MNVEEPLAEAILELLANRAPGATICPGEVARSVSGAESDEWRKLLPPVRQSARSLAREGKVEFTQRGEVVDPEQFKGPVRIRLKSVIGD